MNEPHTLSVYSFRVFDNQTHRSELVHYKATHDRIAELCGEVLNDTEERVPYDEVDLLGCYCRTISSWAELE